VGASRAAAYLLAVHHHRNKWSKTRGQGYRWERHQFRKALRTTGQQRPADRYRHVFELAIEVGFIHRLGLLTHQVREHAMSTSPVVHQRIANKRDQLRKCELVGVATAAVCVVERAKQLIIERVIKQFQNRQRQWDASRQCL
jgi:hypothetical protein